MKLTHLSRLLALLTVVLTSLGSWAAGDKLDCRPGQLYIHLSADVKIETYDDRWVEPSSLELLTDFAEKGTILSIEQPFFFAREGSSLLRVIRVQFDETVVLDEAIAMFKDHRDVTLVERVPQDYFFDEPNDPDFGTQWSLEVINAIGAWEYGLASPDVIIGITDDAFEVDHEEFIGNMLPGWDSANNDADVSPDLSSDTHGTLVAGCAIATRNNGIGIASIGGGAKAIPIKTTTDGVITHGYSGILRAAELGADIINCSWGGSFFSWTNQAVINEVHVEYDCIVVGAAGNDGDQVEIFPGGYNNALSVANTQSNDARASTSSYGSWVDLSAPGTAIFTTEVGNSYGNASGTSFSAPITSSLFALILSVAPDLSRQEVIDCVLNTCVPLDWTGGGAGRIDAMAALECATGIPNVEDVFAQNLMLDLAVVAPGESVEISLSQVYEGFATSVPNVELDYYLSTDCQLDASDILLYDNEFSTIDYSDPDDPETHELDIPVNTADGTYYILVQCDAGDVVEEEDEINNTSCVEFEVLSPPVSVNEFNTKIDITLSPNPTEGLITLQSDVLISTAVLYDMSGRELKQWTVPLNGVIDIQPFAAGNYILQVLSEDGLSSIPLVKE